MAKEQGPKEEANSYRMQVEKISWAEQIDLCEKGLSLRFPTLFSNRCLILSE